MILPVRLLIFLIFCAGTVWLQIFLSRKENKWLGLILPLLSFCISLLAVLNLAAYHTNTTLASVPQGTDAGGVVIQEEARPAAETAAQPLSDMPSLVFAVGSVFLLYNIPTALFLAIYFACREKYKSRKALDKMQAQDLE